MGWRRNSCGSSAAGLNSKSGQWNREQEGDGLDGKAERSSRKELRELSTVSFDDLTLFYCDEQQTS